MDTHKECVLVFRGAAEKPCRANYTHSSNLSREGERSKAKGWRRLEMTTVGGRKNECEWIDGKNGGEVEGEPRSDSERM